MLLFNNYHTHDLARVLMMFQVYEKCNNCVSVFANSWCSYRVQRTENGHLLQRFYRSDAPTLYIAFLFLSCGAKSKHHTFSKTGSLCVLFLPFEVSIRLFASQLLPFWCACFPAADGTLPRIYLVLTIIALALAQCLLIESSAEPVLNLIRVISSCDYSRVTWSSNPLESFPHPLSPGIRIIRSTP